MAWLAVDKDGSEVMSRFKLLRWTVVFGDKYGDEFYLPKGSIRKLIGEDLTWADEPVEIT